MSKTLQWIIGISVILIAAAFVFSAVWPFVAPNTSWASYRMMGGFSSNMMNGQGMMGMGSQGMMGSNSMMGMMGGQGIMNGSLPAPMHNAMLDTLAQKLGLTRAELDSRLAHGETPAQIAASKGISWADFPQIITNAHKAATDTAVADGYLTQEQANAMLNMMGGYGNCPFFGTGITPTP